MTTVATVLNRASRQMLAGVVEERNKLASSLDDSATSVVLSYDLGGFRAGSVFEIESELFYVWEANTASKTLTVERGFNGTTAADVHRRRCAKGFSFVPLLPLLLYDYNSLVLVNQPAPDFELPDIRGCLHKLSDYRGKIVIVNFWSAECPHSERTDRSTMACIVQWGGDVVMLSIAANRSEAVREVEEVALPRAACPRS